MPANVMRVACNHSAPLPAGAKAPLKRLSEIIVKVGDLPLSGPNLAPI